MIGYLNKLSEKGALFRGRLNMSTVKVLRRSARNAYVCSGTLGVRLNGTLAACLIPSGKVETLIGYLKENLRSFGRVAK
jgi:hypothetical protein